MGDRPPTVRDPLPFVGAGLRLLQDPTAFFRRQRARHGDTFLVEAWGHRLLCLFSPEGVRSLYALPEREASFGLATWTLIRPKVPEELFATIRNTPHKLFASSEVERYLSALEEAVRLEAEELGPSGELEVFAAMRRLGHRLGLASWAGAEAASPRYLDRLVPALDRLDSSESFVRPGRNLVTWATKKRRERQAMHQIEAVMAEIWTERERRGTAGTTGDFLDQIHASFADVDQPDRGTFVARDVIVLHMGSQSNLYAALAWTVVNLVLRPDLLDRVAAGDDALLERCAYESIRMAQRSITLRQVLRPVEVDDGTTTWSVPKGVLITTMLSVTNTSAAPGLDAFDPDHYQGRRLVAATAGALPAKELVSTFGHGSHTCPAQRFSISAIRISVRRLLERYELEPRFTSATPSTRQLGAVARAAEPCVVAYRAR